MLSRFALRKFSTTTSVAKGAPGGIPGSNLPFDISNKYKLTFMFMMFIGSGFALPSYVLRFHLTK